MDKWNWADWLWNIAMVLIILALSFIGWVWWIAQCVKIATSWGWL